MTAQFPFLRAKVAPTALAAAIALSFAFAAPAQAQYHYPGSASSSGGHMANAIHPIRARGDNRADYGNGASPSDRNRTHNRNPSMQPGEACPIGSACGPHAPSGASATGSVGYGGGTTYGEASAPRQANAIHPIAAQAVDQRELQPARTSGMNPALGQSRNNIGNRVPTTSYGTSNFKIGQLGPNGQLPTTAYGQKVPLGPTKTVTGPNGQKIGLGAPQTFTGLNGSKFTNGVTTGPASINGVSPQGDHNTGGIHQNNGGMAGVSDTPDDAPKSPTGKANSGGTFANAIDDEWGHPATGTDSQGNTWKDDSLVTGYDSSGVEYRNGKAVAGGNVPKYGGGTVAGDDPDIGPQGKGGATLIGANGKPRNPGQPGGQDPGSGANPDGTDSTSGHNGKNAGTGTYVKATNKNGQDIPVKPKEIGVLNASKLQNGAIDPKRDGAVTTGGSGG